MVLAEWLARKLERNREEEVAKIRAEGYAEGYAEGKRQAEDREFGGNGASENSDPPRESPDNEPPGA